MVSCIIVEDEYDAQELLSKIIAEYCPELTLLGTASDIATARALIAEKSPQLLFLDIQLQSENSFALLDQINHENYKIIFTTAYEEYALKSFKYNTSDYLLKPYSPAEVVSALDKVKRNMKVSADYIARAKETITLYTQDGRTIVKIENIKRLKADRSYCVIYLNNPELSIMVSKPLKDLEERLPPDRFFRSHASHMVNLDYVVRYVNDTGVAILKDGTTIPVSRRRKQEFIQKISE